MIDSNKIKIGVTGQSGFIGTHLYNELGLLSDLFERVPFDNSYFNEINLLSTFVKNCDVLIHLAAVNRHTDENELYKINIGLVNTIIKVLIQEKVTPHIIFSSSIQENADNAYGRSKQEGRKLFEKWAREFHGSFTGMIIPNVYGPFGKPNYNSFMATFCYKLTHGESPSIITDTEINLIYVSSLCRQIIEDIEQVHDSKISIINEKYIPPDFTSNISAILSKLKVFQKQYMNQGIFPEFSDKNDINLFNTFRSYIDLNSYFPCLLKKNIDARGMFVETIKLASGGQVSFSITNTGITRGNHFHSRKIERFTVIKGLAKIQIRKIGTDQIFDFFLDGASPSYVDMPIWYTHNITNVGTDELYTQFWINEWYDETDPDTFFEKV